MSSNRFLYIISIFSFMLFISLVSGGKFQISIFCFLNTKIETYQLIWPSIDFIHQSFLDDRSTVLGKCHDTNGDKTGKDGRKCSSYDVSDCGTNDNDEFKSNETCCICGGGRSGNALKFLLHICIFRKIEFYNNHTMISMNRKVLEYK